MNIIAVDDDVSATSSIKAVLKRAGHAVDTFHDGSDALARLQQPDADYHILITDHFMPRMSGLDLLEGLRQTTFKGKIMVHSAYLNQELEEKYRVLGAEKIVRKPFELHELRKAVEELQTPE